MFHGPHFRSLGSLVSAYSPVLLHSVCGAQVHPLPWSSRLWINTNATLGMNIHEQYIQYMDIYGVNPRYRIYIYIHIFISYWTCYLDVNYRGATIWSPHVFQPRCWRSYAKPCRSSNKSSKHTVILGWLNCSIQAGGPGFEKRVVGKISMFQQIREKSCP